MDVALLRVVEQYYAGSILRALLQSGAFDLLYQPRSAAWLAKRLRWNPEILSTLLSFLAATTPLLTVRKNMYRLSPAIRKSDLAPLEIEKYLTAYAGLFERLRSILHGTDEPRSLVEHRALASAFSRVGESIQTVPGEEVLLRLGTTAVLDIGCGPGVLLLRLFDRIRGFRGWGIDSNPHMCSVARSRCQSMGATSAIRVIRGNVEDLARLLPAKSRDRVEVVHAGSLLNEFRDPVPLLRSLRTLFEGRLLVVDDYYGELKAGARMNLANRRAILQDLVQVLSGQRIPPRNREAWARLYGTAGCRLLRAFDGKRDGVHWLCHVVEF